LSKSLPTLFPIRRPTKVKDPFGFTTRVLLRFLAPPPKALDRRLAATVRAIATATGEDLGFAADKNGMPTRRKLTDKWLSSRLAAEDGIPLLVCNTRSGAPVLLTFTKREIQVGSSWVFFLQVDCRLDKSYGDRAIISPAVEQVGAATNAWWGEARSHDMAGLTVGQYPNPFVERINNGFPELRGLGALDDVACPGYFGWINYWSPRAAARAGLPKRAAAASRSMEVRLLDNGAWLLTLTPKPFNPSRKTDLKALRAAYDLFPYVGGRVPAEATRAPTPS
jgi:hypothetical protein